MRNTNPEKTSSLFLPRRSDITPTGKEKRIPENGETAEISPIVASPAPRAWTKRGKTGFFDIVVEKIAKNPIRQS